MGFTESASVLLSHGADYQIAEKTTGRTPLFIAASGGHVEIGKILISKGSDINAQPVLSSKDTALTISADKGHCEFVELLIANKAQLDVKNKRGNSPLWLSCNSGHLDVVQALIKAGVDVDSQDNRKVSCIMAAFRRGHVRVVKWLVKFITQFPSDNEMLRYISTLDDEELIKKCKNCMDIINDEKSKQAAQANDAAKTLLDELNLEKMQEEAKKMGKKLAASKKRERKKQKRKDCKADEEVVSGSKDKSKKKVQPKSNDDKTPVESKASVEEEKNDEDEDDEEEKIEMPEIAEVKKSVKNKKVIDKDHLKKDVLNKEESNKTHKSTVKNETKLNKDANKKKKESESVNKIKNNDKSTIALTTNKKSVKNEETLQQTKTEHQSTEKHTIGSKNLSLPTNTNNSQSSSIDSSNQTNDKEKVKTPTVIQKISDDDWKEVVRRQKKINVPASAISRVIGRAGCNIKLVREISGAYIDIENQRNSQGEILKTGGDRQIVIKGSNEATKTAYQLITSLVNEPEKDLNQILNQLGLSKPILSTSLNETCKTTSNVSKTNTGQATAACVKQPINTIINQNTVASKTLPINLKEHQKHSNETTMFNKSNNSSLNNSRKNSDTNYEHQYEEQNSSQKSSIWNISNTSGGCINDKSKDSQIKSNNNNKIDSIVLTTSNESNQTAPCNKEQNYFSPFDSILGKVAQETIWSTKEVKPNFASVAAAGLNTGNNNSSSLNTATSSSLNNYLTNSDNSLNKSFKKAKEIQVDISKAPGYRNINLSPNISLSPNYVTPSSTYQSSAGQISTSNNNSSTSSSTLNQIMINSFGPIGCSIGAKSAPCTPPLNSVNIKAPTFTSQHSAIQTSNIQSNLTNAFSPSLNTASNITGLSSRNVVLQQQKILNSPTKSFNNQQFSASSSSPAFHQTKNFATPANFNRTFVHDSILTPNDLSNEQLFSTINTSSNSSSNLNPTLQLSNLSQQSNYNPQQPTSSQTNNFLAMQSPFIGPTQQQTNTNQTVSQQTQPLASNLQIQMRAALLAAGAQLQAAARIQQTNNNSLFMQKQLNNMNQSDLSNQSNEKMRYLQQMQQQQYAMSYLRSQQQQQQQHFQSQQQSRLSNNQLQQQKLQQMQAPISNQNKIPVASNFNSNSKFIQQSSQHAISNTQGQLPNFTNQTQLQLNNPNQVLPSSQHLYIQAGASKINEQPQQFTDNLSEEKRLPRPIGTERAQRKLLPETFNDLTSSFNQWSTAEHQDDWTSSNPVNSPLGQFSSPNTSQLLNYETGLFNGLTNPSCLLTGDSDDYWSNLNCTPNDMSSTQKLSNWQDPSKK